MVAEAATTETCTPTIPETKKKKLSVPPEGYVCRICKIGGHWIQQCPEKKQQNTKKKNPNHVYRPGIDPSKDDIETAKALQKIKPPMCFCRIRSRLKKVKRSFANSKQSATNNNYNNDNKYGSGSYYGSNGNDKSYNNWNNEPDYEHSRAIGKYFFFCAKKKDDPTKCRFARPVEDHTTPRSQRVCSFFSKTGSCKNGDACAFSHEVTPQKAKVLQKKRKKLERDNDSEAQSKSKKPKGDGGSSSSSSSSDSDSSDSSDDEGNGDKASAIKTASATNSSDSSDSDSDSSDSDSSDDNEGNSQERIASNTTVLETKDTNSDSESNSSSSSSSSDSDSDS